MMECRLTAQAKWWVTTQSDANTLEEELVTEGDQAYNLGFETGQGGGDYLGREVRWRRGDGYSNFAFYELAAKKMD